jgi:hypothetical protein
MKKIPMFKPGYYYLHVNDQIIWKPKIVVEADPEYFYSDMVVKVWKVENEEEYHQMMIEAKQVISGI